MATKDFLMPDLGEGLTEGEIVAWLVAEGDTVVVDQPVAEVSTAKAVVEVPSPFAGTVTRLHAGAGEEVEVGRPLLTISEAGSEADAAPAPGAAGSGPGGTVGGPSAEAEVADMVPRPSADAGDGASGNVLVGYGTTGARARRRRGGGPAPHGPGPAPSPSSAEAPPRVPEGPERSAAPRGSTAPAAPAARTAPHAPSGRPLAKPPVRKLAKDLGVDLRAVSGSGPDGVITRDDVHGAADQEATGATGLGAAPIGTAAAGDGDVLARIPLKGVRRLIAEKMTTSRREIPEATAWVEADATALWDLRQRLVARHPEVRVSQLALVLRAVVAGLRAFPELNARLDEAAGEILHLRPIHLGFAAQTDRGLVVPVIRDAHERSTLALAVELARLAEGARAGTLAPADLTGGTFTVSNYGSFGVDGGSPVINHPEAAILGVGRIADKPWVVDGELAVRKVVELSIAFDHRICDGGEAAGFLRFVADAVEDPAALLAHL